MCRSAAGIAATGSHSPAKNIIGKNRIAPAALAPRLAGSTDASSSPRPSSASAPSTTASANSAGWRGNATPNASLATTALTLDFGRWMWSPSKLGRQPRPRAQAAIRASPESEGLMP